MATQRIVVDRGLEGVVVGTTALGNVEGEAGRLSYRGYDIADLAAESTFEEVAHLLLSGSLPAERELADFRVRIAANRALAPEALAMLQLVAADAAPMAVLRTMVSALGLFVPHLERGAGSATRRAAVALIAKSPTIVAAWHRIRRGLPAIDPVPQLGAAANFLYMCTGRVPAPDAERALDTYLVLLADHSFNASTFAARVTASTRADLWGAATAAIAALEGDLHGGAPGRVMEMLLAIERPDAAAAYVRDLLARGEKIMGMGHREYRVRDPRAEPLERIVRDLSHAHGTAWYDVARRLEDEASSALCESKPDRRIFANVEFYSAPLLYELGFAPDEFTCVFACARMAGWTAHVLEQLADNRLIRPQAEYTGPVAARFVPLGARDAAAPAAVSG